MEEPATRKKKTRKKAEKQTTPIDYDEEKARLTKAQADKVELEVALKSGDLIPLKTVEAEWMRMARNFRQKVMLLPNELSNELVGLESKQEIEQLTKTMVDTALLELSGAKYK